MHHGDASCVPASASSAVPLPVAIQELKTFNAIEARGAVSCSGTDQILLDDSAPGASVYVIDRGD
jgi:hypothetical protein